jgi:tetratricopeptide (TPR) repeat protein
MSDPVPFPFALACLPLLVPLLAARQAPIQDEPAEPARVSSSEEATTVSAAEVHEYVQRAIAALDRLDAEVGARTPEITEALQAIVNEVNEAIETVRSLAPTNPWLSYLLGRAYALTGRRADAVDQLMTFVRTREGRNEWHAYQMLGDLLVDEFPRLAQANYEKAKRLNPNEPTATFGLSVCALKRGDTQEALRLVQEAMAAAEKPTLRHVAHLARVLQAAGRFDEALAETDRALRMAWSAAENDPGAREPLVAVDAQYQQLIDLLQARIQAPIPAPVNLYIRLADTVRDRNEVKSQLAKHQALRVLEAGIEETAPDTPPALLEAYGAALAEVGRTAAAIKTFEQLLATDPDNAAASDWLRRLRSDQVTPEGSGPR